MDASWRPEQRARMKDVATDSLRKMKRELEEERARLSWGELLMVPRYRGYQFNSLLENLRHAGENIPARYNNRDVGKEGDEPISGHELLLNVDFALNWIESNT